MSAYLCDDYHISFLAKYAYDNECTRGIPSLLGVGVEELAKMLFLVNVRSVNTRYNETDIPPFKFDKRVEYGELSPLQVIKAAQNFDYQACEPDDYRGSDIERVILYIINHATYKLPGWEDAKWGCPEPKIVRVK